jgi:effector-binding domain-containing protein
VTGQEPSFDARIAERAARPSAAVRVRQPMSGLDLAALFDRSLPAIASRLAELSTAAAAPPYGRYHEFGPEWIDVEIGVPVGTRLDLPPLAEVEPGDVGASELPAGQVAETVHSGPYSTLGQTYDGLAGWIRAQGRKPADGPWESYLDNPADATDPSRLRTEVCWPVH